MATKQLPEINLNQKSVKELLKQSKSGDAEIQSQDLHSKIDEIIKVLNKVVEQRKVVYQMREMRKGIAETNADLHLLWEGQNELIALTKTGVNAMLDFMKIVNFIKDFSIGVLEGFMEEWRKYGEEIKRALFADEARQKDREEREEMNRKRVSSSGSIRGKKDEFSIPDAASALMKGIFAALLFKVFALEEVVRAFRIVKVIEPILRVFGFLKNIGNMFTMIGYVAAKLLSKTSLFNEIVDALSKTNAWLLKFVAGVLRIANTGDILGKTIRAIIWSVGKLVEGFKFIFGAVSKFLAPLKFLIKYNPIVLTLLALWDFFDGFTEEFKKSNSVMKATFHGILRVIEGIITKPLDLIKDGVSWLLKKLGLEEASAFLDSFNFTDLFEKLIDKLMDLAVDFWEWVLNGIRDYAKSTTPQTQRERRQKAKDLEAKKAAIAANPALTPEQKDEQTKDVDKELTNQKDAVSDRIRRFLGREDFTTVQQFKNQLRMERFTNKELEPFRPMIRDKELEIQKRMQAAPQPQQQGYNMEQGSKEAEQANMVLAASINAPTIAMDNSKSQAVSVRNDIRGSSNPRDDSQQRLIDKVR